MTAQITCTDAPLGRKDVGWSIMPLAALLAQRSYASIRQCIGPALPTIFLGLGQGLTDHTGRKLATPVARQRRQQRQEPRSRLLRRPGPRSPVARVGVTGIDEQITRHTGQQDACAKRNRFAATERVCG